LPGNKALPASRHKKPGDIITLQDDLELIRNAVEEAGRIALSFFDGTNALDVRMKQGSSPVSEGDMAVNRHLNRALLGARPDYGWLSEESEDSDPQLRQDAAKTFVVDPIDGTRAFIDGRDAWCVSVAIVEKRRAVVGVLSCPALGFTYHAASGNGAWKDGRRLGMPPSPPKPTIAAPKSLSPAINKAFPEGYHHHKHIPSLAYRLAMVAEGALDATIVKPRSHDWDIAAAALIVEEAGGKLVAADGASVELNGPSLAKPLMIAGRAELLNRMFGVVTADAFG